MSVVNYRVAENIAVLSLANPPVNALSRPLRQGLGEALGRALEDRAVTAVVLTGAGGLGAGADLHELISGLPLEAPLTRDLAAQIERADKPVIAAIEGDRPRRGVRAGARLPLAHRGTLRQGRPAAGETRPHPGRRRHACASRALPERRRRSRRSLPAHRSPPRAHSSSRCSMSSRTRSCPRRSTFAARVLREKRPYAVASFESVHVRARESGAVRRISAEDRAQDARAARAREDHRQHRGGVHAQHRGGAAA